MKYRMNHLLFLALVLYSLLTFVSCSTDRVAEQAQATQPRETKFLSLDKKPATKITVTPESVAGFWKKILPSDLAVLPLAANEWHLLSVQRGDFEDPFAKDSDAGKEITFPKKYTKEQ